MSALDKAVRILMALVIVSLYFGNIVSGTAATIMLVVAGIFIVTSFVSFCPLYSLFHISTYKNKQITG